MVLAKLKARSLLFYRRADCTKYSYDAVGNVTSIKDALNNVMTFVYDELNRRVNTIEANGSKTTFIYDANSQMTGLIDPNSNRTTFIYDALSRQTQEIDALNKTITYTYDMVDQLTQKKDRKSQTIDYSYDAAGRLTGEVWKNSGGTTTNTQTFTYDNANRLLTARDANGAYTFTYDAVGQVTTQKDMWGNTLTFTYDAVGNRTKVQDNFSGVETSVYDAANNLTSRRFGGIGGSSLRLDLSYNAANLLENIKRYNAASGGSLIGQTTYVYDAVFNLTGLKNADGSATVLSQYTYTYDAGNRLTTEVLGGSTTTYTYDVRSQLTGDTTASYGYDSAGNRNNNSQTIGTGNRLSADVNWTYNYDDEGNLTSKVSVGSPTVTWTYTWDVNNRLTAIDKSAGGNSLYNISYKYDVFGNRIEQGEDTDGAGSGASNVTTRFAWEGAKVAQNAWGQRQMAVGMENWNIWADLDGSNNLKVRYVRGDEVDQLFARVKADGTVASYLTDRMGSVRQMVDAGGVLKDTISYDGFGNVIAETDAAFGDRWKWTGRESNAYTGLQYNRARYYNGEIGRWVSEDAIRYRAGDYNTIRYVSNLTINAHDPSGYDDAYHGPMTGGTFLGSSFYDNVVKVIKVIFEPGYTPPPQPINIAEDVIKEIVEGIEHVLATGGPSSTPPSYPADPTKPPGPGYTWHGTQPPGGKNGSWVDDTTGEQMHNDTQHPPPKGPHWDYQDTHGVWWEYYPDGTMIPSKSTKPKKRPIPVAPVPEPSPKTPFWQFFLFAAN